MASSDKCDYCNIPRSITEYYGEHGNITVYGDAGGVLLRGYLLRDLSSSLSVCLDNQIVQRRILGGDSELAG